MQSYSSTKPSMHSETTLTVSEGNELQEHEGKLLPVTSYCFKFLQVHMSSAIIFKRNNGKTLKPFTSYTLFYCIGLHNKHGLLLK